MSNSIQFHNLINNVWFHDPRRLIVLKHMKTYQEAQFVERCCDLEMHILNGYMEDELAEIALNQERIQLLDKKIDQMERAIVAIAEERRNNPDVLGFSDTNLGSRLGCWF
jgi:hypothetical protein